MIFKTSLKTVSLLIVTVLSVLPKVAPPDASDRFKVKFSGPSAVSSLITGIVIVPLVCPAAIVNVPELLLV